MNDPKVNKEGKITLYLLEMIIDNEDTVVCEPIGIYSSFDLANKYLDKVHGLLAVASNKTVVLNVLKFDLDDKPQVLENKTVLNDVIAEQLYSLYSSNILEQMIDTDGTFSYQLTKKYKKLLEKVIDKQQDDD